VAVLVLALSGVQEGAPASRSLPRADAAAAPSGPAPVEWKEGMTIPVRVPTAAPGRELMTTISFPEETIETAITGWPEGEITAIPKRGLLFLRLIRKSEGQLNVIGGSGAHYLIYLSGVDPSDPQSYDSYVKIQKREESRKGDALPKRLPRRPGAVVELVQAMRLGLRPDGAKVLRAKRELAFESASLEVRLLYVYDTQSYRGFIYEVKNTTDERQSVDASRLHGKGTPLVLSALRENVLEPKATTRLYAVTWKE
jgi:hypothetical protein